MKILLVNQSYPPDRGASGQLLGDLFHRLHEMGCEITVVTAPPTYTEQELAWRPYEAYERMRVFRVGSALFKGRISMFTRLAGYLSFFWFAFWKTTALVRSERFDLVTTASNPPIVGLLGVWASLRLKVPFVYMLHDLHPDSFVAATGCRLPVLVKWAWDRINQCVFRGADKIVVVGDGMRRRLEEKGVPSARIETISQWAHPEPACLGTPMNVGRNEQLDRPLTILYFGNLGLGQSLDWLVEAASEVDDAEVEFVLMGDGPEKHRLESLVGSLGLRNVRFLPYSIGSQFESIVASADVCIVALKHGLEELAVPSKTYSILSRGKPVLALLSRQSDVAAIVERYECGWVAESPSEAAQVVRSISSNTSEVSSRSLNAWRAYVREFSLETAVARYWQLFSTCVQSGQGGASVFPSP